MLKVPEYFLILVMIDGLETVVWYLTGGSDELKIYITGSVGG